MAILGGGGSDERGSWHTPLLFEEAAVVARPGERLLAVVHVRKSVVVRLLAVPGVRGWGLGFRVWGLGFRDWGLGFGVWVRGFGVWGLRFRV